MCIIKRITLQALKVLFLLMSLILMSVVRIIFQHINILFLVLGTYMIGESHSKNEANAEVQIHLERGGITRILSRVHNTNGFSDETLSSCLIYKFLVGDEIFCFTGGIVKMNNFSYTTNDIFNSFWGIRLDY